MKSVVKNSSQKAIKFPKLMGAKDGTVVLFWSSNRGMQITHGSDGYIGHHTSCWDMSKFEDFHGSVTLSNED